MTTPMYFSPEILQLITLFTQAALYGLYVATLIHCLRWLVYADDGWKQRDGVNRLMLIATILIFLLSTLNLVLMLPVQLYILGDSNILNAAAFGVISDLTGTTPILIVDAVLIYRCWTVYGHSWRVVCLPIIFWSGSLACAVLIVYYDYLKLSEETEENSAKMRNFVTALDVAIGYYSSNIATNLFSTSAIIYRILHVANASGNRPKRLYNTVRILAESGIIYTSTTVFTLIGVILTANTGDDYEGRRDLALNVLDAINFSMAGITFSITLTRVYKDRLRLTDSYADTGDANREKTLSGLRFRTAHSPTNRTHQAIEEPYAEQDGHARGD